MAHTYKISYYLVDVDDELYVSGIKNVIENGRYITHQVHVDRSKPYEFNADSPENNPNCDLADLERRFDHKPGGIQRIVKRGQIYRHFKGHEVRILAVSRGTEFGEWIVVYEHLGDHTIWHRPLDMFCSLVDRKKYPDVQQRWRFELVHALQ